MNKLRVESRGNFESNAGIKDTLLTRIKMGKEKLHIAYRKTSNKIRIRDLSNECIRVSYNEHEQILIDISFVFINHIHYLYL